MIMSLLTMNDDMIILPLISCLEKNQIQHKARLIAFIAPCVRNVNSNGPGHVHTHLEKVMTEECQLSTVDQLHCNLVA